MAHANLPLRSYQGTRNGCSRREGGKGSWHRELSLSRFVVWTRGEPSGRAARNMLHCGLRESLESALHAQLALGLADLCESRTFTGMDNV